MNVEHLRGDDWRIDNGFLLANGVRIPIISGGAGDTEVDDPPADPPVDDDPPADPPADPAADARAEADRERAERLRLEGEVRALREKTNGPGQPPSFEDRQRAIEQDFASGKLTEAQRIDKLADLRVDQRLSERDAAAAQAKPVEVAGERLDALLTQYPDLNTPGSELLTKVSAQLRDLAGLGFDPKDVRTQLLATERVVGGHRMGGGTGREFHRQRTPTGGHGGHGGGNGGDGGKPDPLKHVPKAQVDHWKALGYTRDQMIAEAPYVKARPARGFV